MSALSRWSQWWSNRSLRVKGLVLIAVPLVILLGALASSYLMGAESRRAQQGAQRTLQIQHDIQEVHSLLAEAATGVRGYLLTGRANFLERYRIAETELPRTLRRLRGQIRDPQQRALLDQVAALAARKSEGLSELVALGNTTPAATLVPILVSNKVVLDELRAHIDAMLAREDVLRRESERFADQVYTRTMVATGVASAAGVPGAFVVVLLFSTGIGRRVRDLADNAQRLARGVHGACQHAAGGPRRRRRASLSRSRTRQPGQDRISVAHQP
ncbi:CHASE3 domain-containing protein [Massilia sp. DJPM01]|uniref:CHASE3 domain-containing protein n=1 Tax=Massilia sp. DJPM01 TaxID=3024404 RepID=UPI00259F1286|nr:CHASE3 domain-containing protein [Massilia sp. DJPM01]MDM5180873.1 CHASE3 domain-containing protein [Massilia sp. DJPM01]